MTEYNSKRVRLALALLASGGQMLAGEAGAWELYSKGQSNLNLNLEAGYGWFSTQRSYYAGKDGRSTWQEGYVKFGVTGQGELGQESAIYAGASVLSSGTWGDGDAAGFTTGTERKTAWEDLYVGWKSGNLIPWLGKDGMDISVGRQRLAIGDGFVVDDDIFNYGDGFGKAFDRGGAYYLSPRRAFDKTVVMHVGGDSGLRGDLAWAQSNNMAQSNTSFALANIEHISKAGTYGFMYLRGLGVRDNDTFAYMSERNGMNLYNIRASSNVGTENFALSGGYVWEDKKTPGSAGYAQADYTFSSASWKPKLTYRYSRFSQHYDPMFYGFSNKSGAWWQGDVAGSYAGPFNSNAEVHHFGVNMQPLESLSVGALLYDFRTLDTRNAANLDAREIDLYLSWTFAKHYTLMPLIGYYDPSSTANGGNGTQTVNSKGGLDTLVTLTMSF